MSSGGVGDHDAPLLQVVGTSVLSAKILRPDPKVIEVNIAALISACSGVILKPSTMKHWCAADCSLLIKLSFRREKSYTILRPM